MEIRRYVSDLLASNMYLIVEEDHAIVVDPFRDLSAAEDLKIDLILLTHEHYDHISGVNLWKDEFGTPVLCSKACGDNIRSPRKNLAHFFQMFCELQTWIHLEKIPDFDSEYSCYAETVFECEMSFEWKGHHFRLMEIPGHSQGSIGIILDNNRFFSGDSMFEKKAVELRFPGGSKKQWERISLPRLSLLPVELMVYPGHFSDFLYYKESE